MAQTPHERGMDRGPHAPIVDEKLKDAVVNPQFTISPPDIVTVELMSNKQKRSVSLGKLL